MELRQVPKDQYDADQKFLSEISETAQSIENEAENFAKTSGAVAAVAKVIPIPAVKPVVAAFTGVTIVAGAVAATAKAVKKAADFLGKLEKPIPPSTVPSGLRDPQQQQEFDRQPPTSPSTQTPTTPVGLRDPQQQQEFDRQPPTSPSTQTPTTPVGLRDPQQQQEFDRQRPVAPDPVPPNKVDTPSAPPAPQTDPNNGKRDGRDDSHGSGGGGSGGGGSDHDSRSSGRGGGGNPGDRAGGGYGDGNSGGNSGSSANNGSAKSGGNGGSLGGRGSFVKPIILDLDGNGVKVTPLSSSTTTFDMAGDGLQHLTAWAGKGDGVLAIDANGDGKIDRRVS